MGMVDELIDWVVTYDKAGLPALIHGFVQTGNTQELGLQLIAITNIQSLDLMNMLVQEYSGKIWKLIGPGAQSVITSQLEPFDYICVNDTDKNQTNDDEAEK